MEAAFQRVRHAWPGFLQASVAGVAKSFSLSRLKLSKFVAAHHPILPVITSGVIAAAVFLAARRCLRGCASVRGKEQTDDRGSGRFRSYPPLRGSDDTVGFTATSIRVRLPRVIDDMIATMPSLPAAAVEKLRLLQAEISSNAVISPLPDTSASVRGEHAPGSNDADLEPDWPSYDREPFVGKCTWQSARWFVCETYFYRKIRAIMSAENGPVDPFSAQKQSLLDNLRPVFEIRVLALMRSVSTISDAISVSLLGNKGDLSLHSVAASLDAVSSPSSLVILEDQHSDALPLLQPTARVAIILDNCGIELVSDLMLAVLLLQLDSCATVTLLCKKRPVWVSDALEKDIHEHMAWAQSLKFEDEDAAAANAKFVAWLTTCLFTDRIRIIAHEFLSGPEAFDEMPAELTSLFETCSLVICKGDANYRRLLGDRHVPADAPFSLLTDYFPAPLLALRTCKSGLICGIHRDVCARASSDWLVSGQHAVIQFKP